jgi:acetylornithine deacetylase/succinyl-diaminopimelate desuccinylase-like protein
VIEYKDYIEKNKFEMKQMLLELASIPAPSNQEEKRARYCKNWLEHYGAKGVYIDEALNVIYPIGCTKENPIVVVMAHMDTVFPDTDEIPVLQKDGKILAPGIGDDTANLSALLFVARYIAENNLLPSSVGVLIVANSGEEGLGNLKGSKQICKDFGKRIKEFISFDGYMSGMCADAVGSKRVRIEMKTEGGHSYGAFGNRNAIAYLSSMITSLYTITPPCTGRRTSYNVGSIKGGTSVNTIAQQAEMLYEFRSDSREDLAFMDNHLEAVIAYYRAKGITVNVEIVGERPCNGEVDETKQEELVLKANRIVEKYYGKQPTCEPGSTDCNIPLSMGIPSVCLGTVSGGGAHTREEWIEESSLETGYHIAFELIMSYFE